MQEIASTELEMLHQESALVENEISDIEKVLHRLKGAYDRQDNILGKYHWTLRLLVKCISIISGVGMNYDRVIGHG